MRCANASELYRAMCSDIEVTKLQRTVADPLSPTVGKTMVEAAFGRAYELHAPQYNLVDCLGTDLRWAVANVLHFFADTEEAEVLLKYNRHAARFLDESGTKWDGAYGKIAMQQIRRCASILLDDRHSRRAVVSMGEATPTNINRPACWSFLHFMSNGDKLNLLCYQRSCAMAVMPYDLVLLTNILNFVATQANMELGSLHWHHGSLHQPVAVPTIVGAHRPRHSGILLPPSVLLSQNQCWDVLIQPEGWVADFARILASPTEVRS